MKHIDLKNIDKQNAGFRIPKGYFEAFENNIMHQIATDNGTSKNTVLSIFHRKHIWMSSIAAVFVVAIGIPLYYSHTANSALESTAIEHYLLQQPNLLVHSS